MRHDRSAIQEYRRLGPFSRCSRRELRRIDGLSTEIWVEPGHVLARQGSLCAEFAVIVSGTAVVNRNGHDVDELGRADHFGEIPLVSYVPNPTTIVALTRMQLEVMNQREFHSMYTTMPTVRYYLDRQIDGRMFSWLAHPEPTPVRSDSTRALARASASIGYTFAQ